jgi:ferritin
MLQWLVDDIINRLKLIGNDGQAIYHLDKEPAARVFWHVSCP